MMPPLSRPIPLWPNPTEWRATRPESIDRDLTGADPAGHRHRTVNVIAPHRTGKPVLRIVRDPHRLLIAAVAQHRQPGGRCCHAARSTLSLYVRELLAPSVTLSVARPAAWFAGMVAIRPENPPLASVVGDAGT